LKTFLLFLFSLVVSAMAFGQAPVNDDPSNATVLSNVKSYCSADGEYSSGGATPFFADQNKDVFFKFTAVAFDVSITVTGNGSSALNSPGIDIYTYYPNTNVYSSSIGSVANGATTTTYYKGGLTIGQTYYFRVYGRNSNTGTFKACVNNYNPILKAGQDYGTASVLCSKASFTQTGVTGAGSNNRESAGTCLDVNSRGGSIEANTAWYKWTAANSGTLTFTITPTVIAPLADDIDWVLYDLGTTGDPANVNAANALRCDASRGVDCKAPNPIYYKTGIRDGEAQLTEPAGCSPTNDGFVKTVDMIQGHVYALLINNFSNGNNGFNIDFGGTGEFVGPTAAFTVTGGVPCTAGQIFTFTNQSANYQSLQWTFGEGATPATATGDGPFFVTYSTVGNKTPVLQALGGQGCTLVADTTFIVGVKPAKPPVDTIRTGYCLLDTLTLNTPVKVGYTYQWTGPNNFSATKPTVKIPLTSYNLAGSYALQVTQFGCTSDTSQINLVSIGKKPVDDFTITSNNLCTPQQSFNITNNTIDYSSLQWDYGSGANPPTQVNANTVNVTYSTYGIKTITLTATGDKGCVTVLSKTVNVPQKPGVPLIAPNTSKYCVGDVMTLSTPAQVNTTYAWSGPNGFTATTATINVPVTSTAVAGTYTLIVTQAPCSSDPASITIDPSQIIPIPIASFTAVPGIPSGTLAVPTSVAFTNTSTLADSYLWNFGDGTTSTDQNPIHVYQTKGNFTVTLTATSQGLCNNSVAKGKLILRYIVSIFIPNTFTPNDDRINDVFAVKITNTKTYHIQIFNRLGTKLFDGFDIANSWKGTYNNQPVPVGTYYYVIDTLTLNDDTLKESGWVTVLR
jgi:gliding motility-associated-like protein